MHLPPFVSAVLLSSCLALPAAAQDRPKAILVLDASGSMWGQIEGTAKITIAQDVVGNLLDELPTDQELGLTVYGHRRKGDCQDIETMVQPGGDTRAAIASAVNSLSPKGKTPLSAAVIQAAEALKYTEEKATVILVSDGIETCDFDPCEVGRQLEAAGVDFTTHVIGFDVSKPEERAQLQCLADETGGQFKTAANALELGEVMLEIVDAEPEPAPEPDPVTVTFRATDGEGGPVIGEGLVWSLFEGDTALVENQLGAGFTQDMAFGEYRVEVLRPADEAFAEEIFGVGDVNKTVTVALPEFRPAATIEAAETAVAGDTIPVRWTGPNADRDFIAVAEPGDTGYVHYTYTREGPLLDLLMPPTPGTYELRYVLEDGRKVLATQTIEVTPVTATLSPPAVLPAGGTVDVGWTGPDYDRDFIAISQPGDNGYEHYAYTRNGSPAALAMPSEPGTYELRYIMENKRTVIATQTVEVTAVQATITPPAALPAGSRVSVDWTGPNDDRDFIAVFPRGEESRYDTYAYTRDGSPADLQLPSEPGEYDLAYVQNVDRNVLVRVPVTIAAVSATVTPPAALPAGSRVQVEWTGPDDDRDFIAVFPRGEANRYDTYAYTRNGSPADLQLPSEPGEYDIAYVQNQGRKQLVTVPVTIAAVSATVTPPADLPAGSTVAVDWTGPDDDRDFIAVFERGETKRYQQYAYTRNGSPAQLTLPSKPGEYDIAYVQNQGRNLLVTVPVTIAAVSATITDPGPLQQGAVVPVEWSGPDNDRDFIAVFPRGEEKRYLTYAYTRNGSPAQLQMPAEPGDYDIGYVQDVGRNILTKIAVTVQESIASVTPPASAAQGAQVQVDWTGPNNDRDYIAVFPAGSDRYTSYAYTSQGSPATLTLPSDPGEYEMAYVLAQGNTAIVRVPFSITAASATLTLAGDAKAGGNLAVIWDGPNNDRDYIAVSNRGADDYLTFTYTREGSPLIVKLPDAPGDYDVVYKLGQGDATIARVPVTVQ